MGMKLVFYWFFFYLLAYFLYFFLFCRGLGGLCLFLVFDFFVMVKYFTSVVDISWASICLGMVLRASRIGNWITIVVPCC